MMWIADLLQSLIDWLDPRQEEEHFSNPFVIEVAEQMIGADWYEEIPTSEGSTMGIVFGTKEHGIKAMHYPYLIHFTPDLNSKMPPSRPPEGYS